jgi:Arc/MetJ-type ribon-helix-helix transcriptional regulator
MKLSVSLTDEDVEVLDAYVQRAGLRSRSAAIQRAISMLRYPTLEQDYSDAWAEWSDAGEDTTWEHSIGDGLSGAAR